MRSRIFFIVAKTLETITLASATSENGGLLSFHEQPGGTRGNNRVETNNASLGHSEAFGAIDDLFEGSDIFARQQRRCPAGQSFCPDGLHCVSAGYRCCPPTYGRSCQAGATCCNGGTHCTYPGGSCCGSTACLVGQTCCRNPDGCAPVGGSCCNPYVCTSSQKCCGKGKGCAPKSAICCPSKGYCDANEQCCPGEEGCAPKGAVCCTGTKKYCPAGTRCCPGTGSGCVSPGGSCCGKYVCDADEQCCGNGDGCAPKGTTCCGKSNYCNVGLKCCDDSNGGKYCAEVCCQKGLACSAGDKCCVDSNGDKFCAPSCYETWTLDFNDFPGFEEIFENMCRGILRSGSSVPGEIILEYLKNKSQARRNRSAAGCRGRNRLRCAQIFGRGWECDEFPFASSKEGGGPAAAMCVPGSHNGAIGGIWGNKVKGKAKGTKFRLKIKNFDCSNVFDKRDQILEKRAGAILKNATDAIYLRGRAFGNSSDGDVAMLIPLSIPDDFQGTFQIDYQLASGSFISGSIIDDDGEDYGALDLGRTGQRASGSIEVGEEGIGNPIILAWARNTQATLEVTTALSSVSPTSTLSDVTQTEEETVPAETTASDSSPPQSGVQRLTPAFKFLVAPYILGFHFAYRLYLDL